MKNKFFFTAGIVGMLSGVAFGATDGAEFDYGREWSSYVTLRGGWLFGGDVKGDYAMSAHPENNRNLKKIPAEFGNTFGACNVTLRHYFGERGFLYGGVGAGIARVFMNADVVADPDDPDPVKMGCGAKAWSFLGQGFTGLGWYLNDNWQLTVGYRLRYLSGNVTWCFVNGANGIEFKMKQNLSHGAEVGITYQF